MGFFAAIQCHEHKDLIRWGRVTESVEGICKWVFRVGIALLFAHLAFRWYGRYVYMDEAGWLFISIWSVLRAAQAFYVSGVSHGMRESSEITKRMCEPRLFD